MIVHNHRESGIWTPVNESKDDPVPIYNYDNGLTYVSPLFHAFLRALYSPHVYTQSCSHVYY